MTGTHSRSVDGEAWLYAVMVIESVGPTLELRIKHFGPGLTGLEEPDETVRFVLVDLSGTRATFGQLDVDDPPTQTFDRDGDRLTVTLAREHKRQAVTHSYQRYSEGETNAFGRTS